MNRDKRNELKVEALHRWTSGHIVTMLDLYKWLKNNQLYRTNDEQFRALHYAEQHDMDHPKPSYDDRLKIYDCLMKFIDKY